MKKALVIGSEGNIGKPLVKHLRAAGWEVLESDHKPAWRPNYVMCDVNHPADLVKAAIDFQPDVVFGLAAMVSRVTCEQAATLCVAANLVGLQNMIEIAKMVKAKFVYFSTSEVYGPKVEIMTEDGEVHPNNRYGLTKYLGESLVEHDVLYHGLDAITLRPFMMYDEEEDLGDHRSAMIRFAYNLAIGRPIEVHEGSARAWFHVSDAVAAITAAGEYKGEYMVVNIGAPDIISIADLAEMIRSRLGASKDLVKTIKIPGQMTAVKNPTLDRMMKTLGVVPKVSVTQGVDILCARVKERIAGGELAIF
jgi:nucleoside-diphosphate-sugar epimerase